MCYFRFDQNEKMRSVQNTCQFNTLLTSQILKIHLHYCVVSRHVILSKYCLHPLVIYNNKYFVHIFTLQIRHIIWY